MTETMLTALGQQMTLLDEAQKPEGSLMSRLLTPRQVSSHDNIELREPKAIPISAAKIKDKYPDLNIYWSQRIIK